MIKTLFLTLFCLSALAISASAQTVVVTPSTASSLGWSTADTRPGGAVNYLVDSSAAGNGALQLTTDSTTAAKAQYMHAANVPLSDINALSYSTKQISASFAEGQASYQLPVCLGGFNSPVTEANPLGCTGFTTLVYEPYQGGGGAVLTGTWQSWDSYAGLWWSSQAYGSGSCQIVRGPGGPAIYTIPAVASSCPDAIVIGFGVNIGTYNPSYNVESDLVNFNGTTYNFEPFIYPTTAGECKNGGWQSAKRTNGTTFKNQGDCIQYVNTGK